MTRKAADNVYLHRDFHNIFNLGLNYLMTHYGAAGVEEYLVEFAHHFYAPVAEKVSQGGLQAVRDAFTDTYRAEDALAALSFTEEENALFVHIAQCPAVTHMRRSGVTPCPCYSMTSSVVWQTICESTEIGYVLLAYDAETGKAEHLFFQKSTKGESLK